MIDNDIKREYNVLNKQKGEKNMAQISDVGMEALERLKKVIPKMTDKQKQRFADVAEGIAIMAEYKEKHEEKKPA